MIKTSSKKFLSQFCGFIGERGAASLTLEQPFGSFLFTTFDKSLSGGIILAASDQFAQLLNSTSENLVGQKFDYIWQEDWVGVNKLALKRIEKSLIHFNETRRDDDADADEEEMKKQSVIGFKNFLLF